MYQERTSYVIPIIIACLAVVIAFGLFICPGSASSAAEEALTNGSIQGVAVLDTSFDIYGDSRIGSDFWGYRLEDASADNIDSGVKQTMTLSDAILYWSGSSGGLPSGNQGYAVAYTFSTFRGASGYLIDADGQRVDFTVTLKTMSSSGRYCNLVLTPVSGDSSTISYYRLPSNPIPARYNAAPSTGGGSSWEGISYIQPTFTYGGYHIGIKEMVIYPTSGLVYLDRSGISGYSGTHRFTYPSEITNLVSQDLYCLESDDKYYFWLFRNNYGSSLIIEGKGTVGIPGVTITNGGRYYTDNFFVTLDKYDSLGVEYGYDIQLTAFDDNNQIVKRTYTFGERGSTPGGTDDPIIIPPSIIEIPEAVHSLITSPGELPSLELPFDFTVPTLTLDLTSGYNTAFNSTWLGVNEAYNATKTGIDSFVSSFAPNLGGLFGDVVYTITTYVDAFRESCEELRNTYAVPFFNLMVRISGLVPSPVWIVFDIWLIYCAVRLVVHVFTCPLADVIRRSF